MSRVDLMKEAIELGIAEKKIGQQLPSLILQGLREPKPYAERMKEIETALRPMFQRNVFLERYIHHTKGKFDRTNIPTVK